MKPRKPAAALPASADDIELFQSAVGPVRRLRADDHAVPHGPRPAAEPLQFLRDEARVMDELLTAPVDALSAGVGDELAYVRDGHDPRLLRRLRRGLFAVQDEIDLHQMTVAAARPLIRAFLADARMHGRRCVKLIPGKGLRSSSGPVLKSLVDGMLRQHGDVIAFASARAADGGTGAVLVLLKSR